MLKRTSKKKEDENTIAAQIVELTTGETAKEKNPAAVTLGRLGGLKGGPARAKKLSSKRRKEIASGAAKKRWTKKP
ncbi:MAG: hypothetical protein MUP52_08360 [Candidatus Aminicenantes bacterium]|nr:hypothetical protein [Candidatus Aminicenantes bacterium]